jgi:hypothetical protein
MGSLPATRGDTPCGQATTPMIDPGAGQTDSRAGRCPTARRSGAVVTHRLVRHDLALDDQRPPDP